MLVPLTDILCDSFLLLSDAKMNVELIQQSLYEKKKEISLPVCCISLMKAATETPAFFHLPTSSQRAPLLGLDYPSALGVFMREVKWKVISDESLGFSRLSSGFTVYSR